MILLQVRGYDVVDQRSLGVVVTRAIFQRALANVTVWHVMSCRALGQLCCGDAHKSLWDEMPLPQVPGLKRR